MDRSCKTKTPPSSLVANAIFRCTALLLCSASLFSAAGAGPIVSCKPILAMQSIKELRVSGTLPYAWKASVFADTRHCATRFGMFEIDFVVTRELGPDLQFSESFRWTAGQFEISLEFSAGEAVLEHRVGFIAPCVCRQMPLD